MKEKKFRQYSAIILVIILSLFLLYVVYKFSNGFFGALLLYVILLPVYKFLVNKKINKKIAATITVLISFFVIIIPLLFVLFIIGNQIFNFLRNPLLIESMIISSSEFLTRVSPHLNEVFLSRQINSLTNSAASLFLDIATNVGVFIINLFIALFLLYFMLVKSPLLDKVQKFIPFNKKNTKKLIKNLKDISYGTVLVGGIIAIVQGGLLTIAFLIFDIKGAFLWGFIAAILSFLPIIGPPIIWVPASLIQFFQRDYIAGTGILILGIFLSNIDNLIRPYLGDKISRIHPLITLIGIFVGVPVFGLIGIFVGPLLISYSLLIIRMFREEYIK
ncbi:AI-2E family transporter [Candidatus Pacearchaeota archaeon]|nr:AI-2E family transporter [Candidatus Pacearchaeota archaeon]MBD3282956.1 AI-2E family transporter [Candidatus Pacearchaeota archaeon]